MRIEEKIDEYLNESKQKGDIVKVVKYKGELQLKVKGMSQYIEVGDMIEFKDTENVRKKDFGPGASGFIRKINKSGTVTVEASTTKRENVKKVVTIDDIHWSME